MKLSTFLLLISVSSITLALPITPETLGMDKAGFNFCVRMASTVVRAVKVSRADPRYFGQTLDSWNSICGKEAIIKHNGGQQGLGYIPSTYLEWTQISEIR